jgi:hypothetical protein
MGMDILNSWHATTGRRNALHKAQITPALDDPARPLLQAYSHTSNTMPGPKNTLLIEGSFEELTDEFAQYIDPGRRELERPAGDRRPAEGEQEG